MLAENYLSKATLYLDVLFACMSILALLLSNHKGHSGVLLVISLLNLIPLFLHFYMCIFSLTLSLRAYSLLLKQCSNIYNEGPIASIIFLNISISISGHILIT